MDSGVEEDDWERANGSLGACLQLPARLDGIDRERVWDHGMGVLHRVKDLYVLERNKKR